MKFYLVFWYIFGLNYLQIYHYIFNFQNFKRFFSSFFDVGIYFSLQRLFLYIIAYYFYIHNKLFLYLLSRMVRSDYIPTEMS